MTAPPPAAETGEKKSKKIKTDLNIVFVGGTILMRKEKDGYAPFFTPRDIAYYRKLKNLYQSHQLGEDDKENDEIFARLKESLLERKSPEQYDQTLRDTILEPGHDSSELLADLGFSGNPRYPTQREGNRSGIDSLDFDVRTHYVNIIRAIIDTIKAGEIPIVVGGTDTLRYYGGLIAEDLRQRGIKTPVILISSMKAFGDDPDHVLGIVECAKQFAEHAHRTKMVGVYGVFASNVKAENAVVRNPGSGIDKLSAHLIKSFVGGRVGVIHKNGKFEEAKNPIYTSEDSYPSKVNDRAPEDVNFPQYKCIAPPLESYNSSEATLRFLDGVLHEYRPGNKGKKIEGVVIKGYPTRQKYTLEELRVLKSLIACLQREKVPVIFVEDPRLSSGSSDERKYGTPRINIDLPLVRELKDAGAIFETPGISSTQVHIRAALGATEYETKPASRLVGDIKAQVKLIEDWKRKAGKTNGTPIAIEYMPDSYAMENAIHVAHDQNLRNILLIGCSAGALPAKFSKVLTSFKEQGMKFTSTFKYAGYHWKGHGEAEFIESADGGEYASAKGAKGIVTYGLEKSPAELYEEMLKQHERASHDHSRRR